MCKMGKNKTSVATPKEADIIKYMLLTGEAEKVVKVLRNTSQNIYDFSLDYILTLALAEHYAGNQQAAVGIYRYVIKKFPENLAQIYDEMVICVPEMEEIYSVIETIVANARDESVYDLFNSDPRAVLTSKQLSLYQQRVSFLCDVLGKKNMPMLSSRSMYATIAHHAFADKGQKELPMRKKLVNLCQQNIADLVVQDFIKATPKDKIKIGVCASRYDNIDFQTLIVSLFQTFDRSKFELIFFAAKRYRRKANLRVFDRIFSKIIFYDENDFKHLRSLMIQEKLDVLLSENTSSCASTFLFFSRVAPVQCNIIDRIASFGAPCIDYYIYWGEKNSYKKWEQTRLDHEKYAILENAYLCPAPKRENAVSWDLTEIGLPAGAKFIFYPQALNRMLPEDDYIVKTLLENNPRLYFIALSHSEPLRFIYYRWKKIMPDCMDRIVFMPMQSLGRFLWVINQASVVLGAFKGTHGVVTDVTVFSQGQPFVVGYGDLVGSAHSKFYYSKMGIEGLLANSHEEGVQIAQRLLDDPEWKAKKSAEITANLHKIGNIKQASSQLQTFILDAYDRAVNGLEPEHWEHGSFVD